MEKSEDLKKREEEFEKFKKWIQPALPFDISDQKLVDMSQPLKVGELVYGKPLEIPKASIKFMTLLFSKPTPVFSKYIDQDSSKLQMKKDKLTIKTTQGEKEVKGYAIRFEPHDHDFVVHKEYINVNDAWSKLELEEERWVVTHKKSGLMLPFQISAHSRIDAIVYAEIMMKSISPEDFNRSLMTLVSN